MESVGKSWSPRWFINNGSEWLYKGGYWESRQTESWEDIPEIW